METRYKRLRHITREVFNEKEMPRLAMGATWKKMTPDQQERLSRIFFDYFVAIYGATPFGLSDVDFKITEKARSGKDILLKSKVEIPEGKRGSIKKALADKNRGDGDAEKQGASDENGAGGLEIMFALRQSPGGYYIRDAKFEGQSVLMFLRSHLESEYKKAMEDADALIDNMRQKVSVRYRAAKDMNRPKKTAEGQ